VNPLRSSAPSAVSRRSIDTSPFCDARRGVAPPPCRHLV
jgi:hypothetical protein